MAGFAGKVSGLEILVPGADFEAVIAGPTDGTISLEAEGLSLAVPFRRHIAKPAHSHSMGQCSLDRSLDEVGCEEGKRNHHVDLPCGASLTLGDAVGIRGWITA